MFSLGKLRTTDHQQGNGIKLLAVAQGSGGLDKEMEFRTLLVRRGNTKSDSEYEL